MWPHGPPSGLVVHQGDAMSSTHELVKGAEYGTQLNRSLWDLRVSVLTTDPPGWSFPVLTCRKAALIAAALASLLTPSTAYGSAGWLDAWASLLPSRPWGATPGCSMRSSSRALRPAWPCQGSPSILGPPCLHSALALMTGGLTCRPLVWPNTRSHGMREGQHII